MNKAIKFLEEHSEPNHLESATATLMLLMSAMHDESIYANQVGHPIDEVKLFINRTLLGFSPCRSFFESTDTTYNIVRTIDSKGQFYVELEDIFGVSVDDRQEKKYDVCISFSGDERELAESVAQGLRESFGLNVFFDKFESEQLWGQELSDWLYDVYAKQSQLVLILFSRSYLKRKWTKHELRAAQSKLVNDGTGNVLPLRLEDVQLPDIFENISYIEMENETLESLLDKVSNRAWEAKRNFYMPLEKITDLINEGLRFRFFISIFEEISANEADPFKKVLILIIGLVACLGFSGPLSDQMEALLKYLVFIHKPIAGEFNSKDEIVISNEEGGKLLRITFDGGPLMMNKALFADRLEEYKSMNPSLFE
ncbi:toll/interleukin-1 receptor domain-containing protein [Planktomarina temperata]|nr:toll/interleukin-1 receptor domain-containing protein [Planktomarina temperata]